MKLQRLQQKKETRRREKILKKKGKRKEHNLIEIEDSRNVLGFREKKNYFQRMSRIKVFKQRYCSNRVRSQLSRPRFRTEPSLNSRSRINKKGIYYITSLTADNACVVKRGMKFVMKCTV
jgi:hypothetical protein